MSENTQVTSFIRSTIQEFRAWPRWVKVWVVGVLLALWVARATFAYQNGNGESFHTDGSTELFSIFAAKHFAKHGFLENHLLPTYPPFGRDPDGKDRTQPFVYHHYLAGPDYVLGTVVKVFGENAIWSARLIPLTFTVLALFFLTVQFARVFVSPPLAGVLISLLMVSRGLTIWSINLYGHSYVMMGFLWLVAILLWTRAPSYIQSQATHRSTDPCGCASHTKLFALGFIVGLNQMFFAMDWVPLTFMAGLGIALVLPTLRLRESAIDSAWILFGVFCGSTAAVIYQLTISALHFGSLRWVIENLLQWGKWRTEGIAADGLKPDDLKIHKVWHEFDHQTYGTTGWTAVNLLVISTTFLAMGWTSRLLNSRTVRRILAGLAITTIGAAMWSLAFRQHALIHVRFINRHYFVIYMAALLVILPIARAMVLAARRSKTSV